MSQSPSILASWLDREFYSLGAFLTSFESGEIIFAKGGEVRLVDHFSENDSIVFYLKDFFDHKFLAYFPRETFSLGKSTVLGYLKDQADSHNHFSPTGNDDDLYEKDFHLLKHTFGKDLEKVVLISRETYQPFENEKTIRRLLRKAFEFGIGQPYGMWNHHYGVIGSTPELLYSASGKDLKTFALAGTMKMGLEEELLHSAKDRHEHNLVIQDIQEKLAAFSTKISSGETHIQPYRSIVHLRTDITASLKEGVSFEQLTTTLSPTAALGGYPKYASLKFLRSCHYGQKYAERYFGSCFGIISQERKEFVVSIRNVQWSNGEVFIESGGGVVQESEIDKEMEEIRMKRNTIRNHYL